MDDTKLRAALIRLAHDHAEMRPHVLPLITAAAFGETPQWPALAVEYVDETQIRLVSMVGPQQAGASGNIRSLLSRQYARIQSRLDPVVAQFGLEVDRVDSDVISQSSTFSVKALIYVRLRRPGFDALALRRAIEKTIE